MRRWPGCYTLSMTQSNTPSPDERRRQIAGSIGWGLLFALAAVMLVVRMLNGGGGC